MKSMENFLKTHKPLKPEPFPFNEDQEAFIKELETTNKPQDRGYLRTSKGYCCLGVACELFGLSSDSFRGPSDDDVPITLFKFTSAGYTDHHNLPMPLTHRLRLRTNSGDFMNNIRIEGCQFGSLVSLNDHVTYPGFENHFGFKDIAAYMRHDPWNVFMWPDDSYNDGVPLS